MWIRLRTFRKAPRGRWLVEQVFGSLVALFIILVVSGMIVLVSAWVPVDHVTIAYLTAVIIAALLWGAIPAVVAAIASVAIPIYFFYPPFYEFRIQNSKHIADIVMFVISATIASWMAVTVRRAKIRAQVENLRDALIGSVSHELHTPLAAIVGSTSILSQSPLVTDNEHLSSLVRVVRKEAERLNGDILNLVDATRISSEGIRPTWQWVDPEDIVSGALARKWQLLADRKVELMIADDLPLVYVDPALVESALSQLIENATKYSAPDTPISITAVLNGKAIQIEVADEGEGIALGEIEKVFGRFYRSPRHANATSGSGLGLWIARELIETCGGRVQASSPGVGCGTTFRIDLPVRTQPSDDEQADD